MNKKVTGSRSRLVVSNLPYDVTEETISKFFNESNIIYFSIRRYRVK
jgi:RNA recognition motif-containing protein